MTRSYFAFFLISIVFILQSCAVKTAQPVRQDPLIGKIIDVQTAAPISFETMIDRIAASDVIYLSEKHDNPAHHMFQQKVIQALINNGTPPVLGFEFFAMDDTPHLLNFVDSANSPHSKEAIGVMEKDLRKKLGWDTQSDKMWQYYFDLLTIARDNRLLAAGIDLADVVKKRITRKGIDQLHPLEKDRVFSTDMEDEPYKEYMLDIFKAVHCGMGHGRMQERLWGTWVARNDKMALSISSLVDLKKGPVVVIIGGGHTEYGLGVIDRVTAIDPAISQINVALKEIRIHPAPLSDYLSPLTLEERDTLLPADFISFSQRASYEDPCEKFKKHLKKMKGKSTE